MSDTTNVTVKKLEGNELIDDACALLYKEYIETSSWVFSSDNPSELEVITKNNRKLLVDRVTSHAIWFGAFDDNKIVGCIRIFKATNNVPFEIELYPTAQEIVQQYIEINKPNLYEGSRACVHSEYRGKNILALLYLNALEHCQKEKASIFGSTSNVFAKSVLRRIEWPCKKENAFKFEEADSAPVSFYLANDVEIINMIKNIKLLEKPRNRKTFNILDALKIVAPIFPAPIYWHDTKGVVLGINAQCLKGMHKSIKEVLGKTPYDFYPKEIADYIWKNSVQVLTNGETLTQEEYAYDISGKCIGTYLAIKAPLYDENGQTLGVLGTSIDVTERKNLEIQLKNEKDAVEKLYLAKNAALHNLEHDLRTPFTGIVSLTRLLFDMEKDPEKRQFLELILSSGNELLEFCNSILDAAQLEAGLITVVEQAIDLTKLVTKLMTMEGATAKSKGLELIFDYDKELPAVVMTDPHRVQRILLNLFSNAIKFTQEGFVKISIKKVREEKKYIIIQLIVEDSGIGIPEDKQRLIFEKQGRLSPSNQNKYKGIGLGLSSVTVMMSELEGEISLNSIIGKGTTFICTLPVKKSLLDAMPFE